ncbi:MAG: helix-turn-helix domain-containing protein [Bradyrhizobium sp.]|nr:helix-turn-helix domain-containing protein [Bradyrhizobium sp.]
MTGPNFAPDASGTLRFSTDDLSEPDGLTIWRELCGRTMMRLDMEPLSEAPFHCEARIRVLPGLAMSSIVTAPNRLTRDRSLIADGNDDLILAVAVAGEAVISQRDQDARLGQGDAVLISSAEPSISVVPSDSHFVSLAIPLTALTRSTRNLEQNMRCRVPQSSLALRLLTSYLLTLDTEHDVMNPEFQHSAINHIYDLVALTLGATRDAAETAKGRGLRAARLRAIKADILDNIGQHDLSADIVAARHGISSSYLRKLFDGDGTTFTDFVLSERLARAYRMLGDPRLLDHMISTIAYEAGFGDLSYFNRAFRRKYGVTPTDIREAARLQR